ncbi:MAG: hypothetical protein QNJ98_14415 [Planctomycetota bacterium]|nr:hypothetical protein [Planctomycetota bacterium]
MEPVEAFVAEFDAKFPIQIKAASGDYSTGGVPQAYLISPEGTILWEGNPAGLSDSTIEEHLKEVEKENRVSTWSFTLNKVLPPIPDKLKGARKDLDKMKFGSALKKVEAVVEKLEGDDKTNGDALREWIAKRGDEPMEKAATLIREGDVYAAYKLYGQVEDDFKGHALSKQAKEAAKALTKDKAHKLEIKAGEKLDEAKTAMREERKPEDKLECLKGILGKKYAETKAGKEAAEIAEKLEGMIEK